MEVLAFALPLACSGAAGRTASLCLARMRSCAPRCLAATSWLTTSEESSLSALQKLVGAAAGHASCACCEICRGAHSDLKNTCTPAAAAWALCLRASCAHATAPLTRCCICLVWMQAAQPSQTHWGCRTTRSCAGGRASRAAVLLGTRCVKGRDGSRLCEPAAASAPLLPTLRSPGAGTSHPRATMGATGARCVCNT